MASLFIVGTLDARYKIEIKVEGALKGLNGNYFHFQTLVIYNISIISVQTQIFTISYVIAVSVLLGDGENTDDVGQLSLIAKRRSCECRKRKCTRRKSSTCVEGVQKFNNFRWCKQNCACCKTRRGKPQIVGGLRQAKKCRKWINDGGVCKCKFGKPATV